MDCYAGTKEQARHTMMLGLLNLQWSSSLHALGRQYFHVPDIPKFWEGCTFSSWCTCGASGPVRVPWVLPSASEVPRALYLLLFPTLDTTLLKHLITLFIRRHKWLLRRYLYLIEHKAPRGNLKLQGQGPFPGPLQSHHVGLQVGSYSCDHPHRAQ